MQYPIAMALLVASIPIIVALCRVIGPGRAAPIAILGAFLILPRYNPDEKLFGFLTIDKLTVAGISLAVGGLLFDRRTLAKARLHWVDGPMLLYIAAPLISLACGATRDVRASLDQSWMTLMQWGVPYFLGRIYYADRDAPRRLSIAVVIAACLYIPFCVFEMVMGTGWYLRPLLFNIRIEGDYRLGGWRPVGMMTSGLELVSWMSLATILSTWLWACRERWKPPYVPSWVPPVALLVTAIACRGIYGYVTLAVGFSAVGLLLLTRSRWVLVPFLLLPLVYIGLRVSGAWDGQGLAKLAGLMGEREVGSMTVRLTMEDQFLAASTGNRLVFGLGGHYADSWADGWWLMLLKRGGLLALVCHYTAFLLPAVLFLFRRSSRPIIASAAAGLALFVILQMIDSLHNTPLIAVSTLLGGSLAGFWLGKSVATVKEPARPRAATTSAESPSRPRSASANPGHVTYRLGDILANPPRDVPRKPAREQPREAPRDVPPPPHRRIAETSLGSAWFALALACLLYVFGHGRVEGQEAAKFVGGLASALLFAAVGAIVAGSSRRSLARVAVLGLVFGALGISFNLALHPSTRPVWSADILQGMALSGLAVAAWRRLTDGGGMAYAALAVLAGSWWVFEPYSRPFPGSQYLFEAGSGELSLFPMLPWLTLSAVGAWLFEASLAGRLALALGLGILAALGWNLGPIKFPLSPVYALAGGSLASAAFALAGPCRRSAYVRTATDWLGQRWLIFFYLHLGIAAVLGRVGPTQPVVAWVALGVLSIAATWLVSATSTRLRPVFAQPATWAVLLASTLAIGLWPGLPSLAVVAVAGMIGVLFAAGFEDLAALILGPPLEEPARAGAVVGGWPRHLATVALVAAAIAAPELVARLPSPFGLASRPVAAPAIEPMDQPEGTPTP